MKSPPIVLSIAGYDPSSGAGITADIKTAASLGCYAVTCITALTVQSTQGVFEMRPLEPDIVARTLSALADDLEIAAVRVGMLGSAAVAEAVADFLKARSCPHVVLDPVIRSSSDAMLLDDVGLEFLRRVVIPLCDVMTPNVDEAARLVGAEPVASDAPWEEALPRLRVIARELHGLGSRAVVITGGHLSSSNDYLSYRDDDSLVEEVFTGTRIGSGSTHGTGCAFAIALACQLAIGRKLPTGVRAAKDYVRRGILAAFPLGKGIGPINHGV